MDLFVTKNATKVATAMELGIWLEKAEAAVKALG
jgi:hypothetical protein